VGAVVAEGRVVRRAGWDAGRENGLWNRGLLCSPSGGRRGFPPRFVPSAHADGTHCPGYKRSKGAENLHRGETHAIEARLDGALSNLV